MASNKNIAATVREGILPTADALGYALWDVEFLKEGARRILRVTIDNEQGITIDDCERMHRAIDPILDEIDPIDEAYDLEVSSPGIERDLRTSAHIDACIGERVEARFFAPFEGIKQLEGCSCLIQYLLQAGLRSRYSLHSCRFHPLLSQ